MYDHSSPETIWVGRVHLPNYNHNESWVPTLDIFVMDNAPDSRLARKIRLLEVLFLQGMIKVSPNFKKGNLFMRTASFFTFYLGKLFSRKSKLKCYDKVAQKSNGRPTNQLTCYYEEYRCLGRYYPSDLLNHLITVSFEGMEVFVVKDFDRCLTEQFGDDYMTPPPVAERIVRHIKKQD